ncbi:hypothetical protein H6764_00295 [Candidatus Nomurabacteria bacterium]|nr:hypothetical protein [Candidatus Nomurabacteria bacterium]
MTLQKIPTNPWENIFVKNSFIYGVPGVGKTHYSEKLAVKNYFPLYELDQLREDAQKKFTKAEKPFLYMGTTQAFKAFGELNRNNVIKGFLKIRKEMKPFVEEFISSLHGSYIVEAAFITPKDLVKYADGLLVTQRNESIHKRQFFTHREINNENKREL